ncbi:hypothetical protein [Desulfolithobacter dissulfuricans]|uniref:hypothetical protein n=1 Tax=Desulfolithobacter dissulfuricans TaxID=2795293 RepID=UPI0022778863|nr:hypothetical protein [Desulfolithobacter dissulfuricans]
MYDRSYRELAVSYPLFGLYVRPAEIEDKKEIAGLLARLTGRSRAEIDSQLRSPGIRSRSPTTWSRPRPGRSAPAGYPGCTAGRPRSGIIRPMPAVPMW